jgi:hypothetical protein
MARTTAGKNNKKATPRPKTVLEIMEEEQRQPDYCLAGMNPKLREVCERVRQWQLKEERNIIIKRYELGEIIKDVHDDNQRSRGWKYGEGSMKKLAFGLGIDATLLYESAHFAMAYTRTEVEELVKMRNAAGHPISWSHIRWVVRETPVTRQELLQKAMAENWTSVALAYEVKRRVDARWFGAHAKVETRGRKLAKPKNLDDAIRQQASLADKFLERDSQVWNTDEHCLTRLCLDMPPDAYTQERAEKLREHAQRLRQLAQEADQRATEAEQVYQDFVEKLARWGKANAAKNGSVEVAGRDANDTDDVVENDDMWCGVASSGSVAGLDIGSARAVVPSSPSMYRSVGITR